MAEREENTSKCMILCDCCGRDITHRMIIWIHDEPFCYECAEKRVKHEQIKTGSGERSPESGERRSEAQNETDG